AAVWSFFRVSCGIVLVAYVACCGYPGRLAGGGMYRVLRQSACGIFRSVRRVVLLLRCSTYGHVARMTRRCCGAFVVRGGVGAALFFSGNRAIVAGQTS